MPALEARDISLSWDGRPVIAHVSLDVAPGELVCLVGRSGCGKTTLFQALAGLSVPDEGEVLLHGGDVTGRPGHVSYMLQKDLLLPSRTVIDNVCLPLLIKGVKRSDAHATALPYFERFGLAGSADLWPSQLSGGMRQRAALLRTYLMENDVVLLDEPFSALDALTRIDMRGWFCDMARELGLSALIITHDVDEAISMASRVFVMGGDPAAGVPSTIVGEVDVPCPPDERVGFDLTEGYLACKREVLGLLG
ncbi:MAG: ABC transporter ATP-binding protein [Atopobiaceae bacterium]|jgi:ABC-type nitrate/sulfonate/bicarbonate transport system ATPase subunit|nr:ABC transporter ATP-binding protein [Atopobiaceae bacterium]